MKADFKKVITILLIITDVLLLAGLVVNILFSYFRMEGIVNQLAYLQDTSNIIQTDVGNLESNIEATLEEESSLIEDYSIKVTDTDFAAGTYEVAVSVIPKEYTDSTQTSIYFGTQEYFLELKGYVYEGNITLPLDTSYDGNVTILFTNGDKKMTEVLREYIGFQTGLDDVVSGGFEAVPEYKEAEFSVDTNLDYQVQGYGRYEFNSIELIATKDEEEIYKQDLISGTVWTPEAEEGDDSGGQDTDDAVDGQVPTGTEETVGELIGNCAIEFEQMIEPDAEIRIFLRVVSEQGFTFECDLFAARTEADGEGTVLVTEPESLHYTVFDEKGGRLERR